MKEKWQRGVSAKIMRPSYANMTQCIRVVCVSIPR